MNIVGELLTVDDIRLDLDVPGKEPLLLTIAGMLAHRRGLSESEVLASLVQREQLGSTALGHGVAIPHARMDRCGAAAAVLVRTRNPIPFDAPDNRPVSIFMGLIVPKQANERHLQLLATAAAMFSDRNFRGTLRTCADPGAMRELVAAWREPGAPNPVEASVE